MTTDHSTQDTATTAQGNRPRLSPIRIGFLCDVLGTAVEGGIGYWSHVLRGERGVPAGTPGWEGADMAALAWTSVTVVDIEDDELVYTVTLAGLARALNALSRGPVTGISDDRRRSLAWANRHNDAGADDAPDGVSDIDADLADCAFQLAALGTGLYG